MAEHLEDVESERWGRCIICNHRGPVGHCCGRPGCEDSGAIYDTNSNMEDSTEEEGTVNGEDEEDDEEKEWLPELRFSDSEDEGPAAKRSTHGGEYEEPAEECNQMPPRPKPMPPVLCWRCPERAVRYCNMCGHPHCENHLPQCTDCGGFLCPGCDCGCGSLHAGHTHKERYRRFSRVATLIRLEEQAIKEAAERRKVLEEQLKKDGERFYDDMPQIFP